MRRIILDTNILHQEGLASRNMQQLGRLAAAGKVEICVPALVKREFLSKRVLESLETLLSVQRNLKDVANRIEYSAAARDGFSAIESSLSRLRLAIGQEIDVSFRNWAEREKVRELPFEPEAIGLVLDDYFAGTGAFRKPKHRDDIIDSMIASCIRTVIAADDQTFVALKDGAFKRYLTSLEHLAVVDSVAEFLAIPEIKAELEALDREEDWPNAITQQLEDAAFQQELRTQLVSGLGDLLYFVYLEDEQIVGSAELTVQPNWGVRLNGITAKSQTQIAFGAASYDSDQNFSLDVVIQGNGQFDYVGYFGDYNAAGEDSVTLESMDGDGACDLREIRRAEVVGYLTFSMEAELPANELLPGVQSGDVLLELHVDRGVIISAAD
jgi:hypothetical protein